MTKAAVETEVRALQAQGWERAGEIALAMPAQDTEPVYWLQVMRRTDPKLDAK